jgi:hypothetical protein
MSEPDRDLERRVAELETELERLEAANAELRRTNARLGAQRLAKLDSAAASALLREAPARPPLATRLRGGARERLRALALRILR